MGDVNQLLPVARKSIGVNSNTNKSCSADAIGKIVFSEFMDPSNQLKIVNFTFHMTYIVRKRDE